MNQPRAMEPISNVAIAPAALGQMAKDIEARLAELRIHATTRNLMLVSLWMNTKGAILFVDRRLGVIGVFKPDQAEALSFGAKEEMQ